MYGFKLLDITGGEYRRWFNSNGTFYFPMVEDLEMIAQDLDQLDFYESAAKAKHLAYEFGFDYVVLTEGDFRETENPVKKLLKKLFGWRIG